MKNLMGCAGDQSIQSRRGEESRSELTELLCANKTIYAVSSDRTIICFEDASDANKCAGNSSVTGLRVQKATLIPKSKSAERQR